MREWEKIIPEVDRALYQELGFGTRRQAFGVRPALFIIDVARSFIGSKPMPLGNLFGGSLAGQRLGTVRNSKGG